MHTFQSVSNSHRRTRAWAVACVLATLVVAAGFPVHAQDRDPDQDDALPFAKPGDDSAMIVGAVGKRAQYIYPVVFTKIDDHNIHPREVMWLKPGEYELTIRAFITNPPGLRRGGRSRSADGNDRITVVVEAGKEYSIGAKYDPAKPASMYNTVLYRVEEK